MQTRCSRSRLLFVDALKAFAAQFIVLHHLAFYGPMSDVAYTIAPDSIDWLFNYGRVAVQVFLVVGGFLAARALAPEGVLTCDKPWQTIGRRYLRLAAPFLCALAICMVCAMLARQWMDNESIPSVPQPMQLLAHVFLLQDLVGQEALTAGAWYVAIDFQLFALFALMLWLARKIGPGLRSARRLGVLATSALMLCSLFFINGKAEWANSAPYYFGAYGLGIMAYWLAKPKQSVRWVFLVAALAIAALAVDFRIRIAVALAVACALAIVHWRDALSRWPDSQILGYLSRISYSLFLIHFPVCLLVNAAFARLEVDSPYFNLFGMALAWLLSIVSAALFHRFVETRAADILVRMAYTLVNGLTILRRWGHLPNVAGLSAKVTPQRTGAQVARN